MNIIKVLALGLATSLSLAAKTEAEVPPRPADWVAKSPMQPCTPVESPDKHGVCRVFQDQTGQYWIVFWDAPGQIVFIRGKVDGEMVYLYQREAVKEGQLL